MNLSTHLEHALFLDVYVYTKCVKSSGQHALYDKKNKSIHYYIPLFNKMSFVITQSFICIYLSMLWDTQVVGDPISITAGRDAGKQSS